MSRSVVKHTKLVVLCVAVAAVLGMTPGAHAGNITFDGSPGTSAPPATLGPYTMAKFGADARPVGQSVNDLATPEGGAITFAPGTVHRKIGQGWATWSHNYTGDVYTDYTHFNMKITMPSHTVAFYVYVEPDFFGLFPITATADDGTTSGAVLVDGFAGATYFGFYATGGSTLGSVTLSTDSFSDFAFGEFGIKREIPTSLSAEAAVADLGGPAATLTLAATLTDDAGAPLAGKTIDFAAGSTALCSATTGADGRATCGSVPEAVQAALNLGYTATFAGSGPYQGSSASGQVVAPVL